MVIICLIRPLASANQLNDELALRNLLVLLLAFASK